jgi:hypothetical protein
MLQLVAVNRGHVQVQHAIYKCVVVLLTVYSAWYTQVMDALQVQQQAAATAATGQQAAANQPLMQQPQQVQQPPPQQQQQPGQQQLGGMAAADAGMGSLMGMMPAGGMLSPMGAMMPGMLMGMGAMTGAMLLRVCAD